MRLFYLLKKEMLEIFRQKEMLAIMFIAPIIQTILLGYVVTTDVKNLPVEIINLSSKESARRIENRIVASPLFQVKGIRPYWQNPIETFQKNQAKAVIMLRDRTDSPPGGMGLPEVFIVMDGVDANSASIAAGYFNGVIKKYILDEAEKTGFRPTLINHPVIRFNPDLKSINTMGPGIVALLLTIIVMFLTSITLVREKEQQTLDTLLISRLRPIEIFLGKALPMAILGLLEMGVGLIVVFIVFRIPVRGSLPLLFAAAGIFLSALLSYALLISILSTSQQQALFFSWFSMVTFLMLSGLFTPIENIPPAFKWLADINPLRYLIKIIRDIFLKGSGIEAFYKDILILSVITLTVMILSLLSFKRLISR